MNRGRVTVAVEQAEVAPDLDSALERTAAGVREAQAAWAQLVVFPETWIPGYPVHGPRPGRRVGGDHDAGPARARRPSSGGRDSATAQRPSAESAGPEPRGQ